MGDCMLVNGYVWPHADLEPRKYRLRILNGCNARILNLDLGGLPCWQIGSEGGLFATPVPVRRVCLAPAERADLVVDFAPAAGSRLPLQNLNPPPPVSTPAPSLAHVMQFRVGTRVSSGANDGGPATWRLADHGANAGLGGSRPVARRVITLNEVAPDTPGWYLNLNSERFEAALGDPRPRLGTVEDCCTSTRRRTRTRCTRIWSPSR